MAASGKNVIACHYKLMMATNWVVKEVLKYERFKVTGLRANAEYIFCVKAIYDDGKHVVESRRSARGTGAETGARRLQSPLARPLAAYKPHQT